MIVAAMGLIFMRLPGGFLPEEDQGTMFALVQAPPGGTLPRTQKALDVVRNHFLKDEKAAVDSVRSEEHTSELQSLMRISYAVFCLKKKNNIHSTTNKLKFFHMTL